MKIKRELLQARKGEGTGVRKDRDGVQIKVSGRKASQWDSVLVQLCTPEESKASQWDSVLV